MNALAADILSPTSTVPSDGTLRVSRANGPVHSTGGRKDFSDALRKIRDGGGKDDLHRSDDGDSSKKVDDGPRLRDTRSRELSSAQTGRSNDSSSQAVKRGGAEDGRNKSPEVSETGAERAAGENDTESNSQVPALFAAPILLPTPTPTAPQEQVSEEGTVPSSGDDVQTVTTFSGATPISREGVKDSVTVPQTKEGRFPQDDAVIPAAEGRSVRAVDRPAAEAQSSSQDELISKQGMQVDGTETDMKTAPASGRIAPDISGQKLDVFDRATDVLSRKDLQPPAGQILKDGGTDGIRPDSERGFGGIPIERPVPLRSEGQAEALSNHDNLGARTTQTPSADFRPIFGTAEAANQLWSDHKGQQQEQRETNLPQAAVADSQLANGQRVEPLMVGGHSPTTAPHPTSPPTVSPGGQTAPVVPASDMAERSFPGTRSVVFDVAQSDLGHVNIRVAMTNDVVHTYLSADRPEVGQFLMNGQDRLQAAFQANGLDMGQFRVDIDRQSAGRSFQHGSPQEQGQTWNQGSQGMPWGQNPDGQDEQRLSLHGLLNVVA